MSLLQLINHKDIRPSPHARELRMLTYPDSNLPVTKKIIFFCAPGFEKTKQIQGLSWDFNYCCKNAKVPFKDNLKKVFSLAFH